MIWDLHCHLSGVTGRTPAERMGRLIEIADRVGIERLCFYMGMTWTKEPTPEDLQKQNDEVLEALQHYHDRAFGFCYVSGDHVEKSLSEIERCIAAGPMVGIKLWVAHHCNDPAIDPIIRRAAELKAVIYQHTWLKTDGTTYPGESSPYDLVELAKRHPRTPLILGHTGGQWELGIRAVRAYPNVSIDIAGSDPTAGLVEMAVRELGAERVIYGSDCGGRSFASQIAKVHGAEISEREKRLIFKENLKRMLMPILKAKNVQV
ncbi:MAG: amidohydrolase [Pirellula sp.]|nr:amidohydrolase [Pirellula sp.]